MKLEFSGEKAERFLEMAHLGGVMINARREEEEQIPIYDELEQQVLGAAHAQHVRGVEHDSAGDRFVHSRSFEEGRVRKYQEEYDEHVFWDELAARLTRRDLERQYGRLAVEAMDQREVERLSEELEDRYWEEFEARGIDRLGIWEGL